MAELIEGLEVVTGAPPAEPPPVAPPPAASPLPAAQPPGRQYFAASAGDISFQPSSIDAKKRTVDVVWYGGQSVPRTDPQTGEPFMLRLDMAGCRLERLNANAPVFDCHMNGLDYRSASANQLGTKAQRGTVVKAWAEGPKGLATLQFGTEGANPDTDMLWSGIQTGRIGNLSFGTWVYAMSPARDQNGNGLFAPHTSGQHVQVFVATDWEPFEISPITVAADFSTEFLSAAGADGAVEVPGATSPQGEIHMETTQAGTEARTDQAMLDAARAEGATLERTRVSDITALGASFKMEALASALIASGVSAADAKTRFTTAVEIRNAGTPMLKHGVSQQFLDALVNEGISLDAARKKLIDEIAVRGEQTLAGIQHPTHSEFSVVRDGADTMASQMEASFLLRFNPQFYAAKDKDTGQYLSGCSEAAHQKAQGLAREFIGYSILEMGRQFLEARGIRTRGYDKNHLAELILRSNRPAGGFQLFEGGAESTSDFPALLANVANKTLRQAYQAYKQTFKVFCRQVTASDFKPINRVQVSDAPALQPLNEKGEYHRANLTDSNVSYQLATFGEIVALTRKTIINDDTQAFTRIPAILGVAAARLESDKVWAVITGNPAAIYTGDTTSTNLFAVAHSNLFTTVAGSALGLAGLEQSRMKFRLQTAPQGTPLDLTPRYLAVPAALESVALQLVSPTQLAATAVTGVIPAWVMSMIPVVEPRLDAAAGGSTAWYAIADPADIDTVEYCYLEGQEGVYMETKQGFEVDGIEIKARMDFAAAAIEYRGLQKNTGAA